MEFYGAAFEVGTDDGRVVLGEFHDDSVHEREVIQHGSGDALCHMLDDVGGDEHHLPDNLVHISIVHRVGQHVGVGGLETVEFQFERNRVGAALLSFLGIGAMIGEKLHLAQFHAEAFDFHNSGV